MNATLGPKHSELVAQKKDSRNFEQLLRLNDKLIKMMRLSPFVPFACDDVGAVALLGKEKER